MVSLKEYLAKGQTTISNLLLENYHHLGLTNDEFLLWLQLYRSHEQGNDFPDLREIASVMGSDQKEIYHWLNQLLKKDVLRMGSKKDDAGKMVDYYDFTGIYERLEFLLKQQSKRNPLKQMKRRYASCIAYLKENLVAPYRRSNTNGSGSGWMRTTMIPSWSSLLCEKRS